ncbi:DUF5658 family protein [uncultured Novosphingobium sp.]|uniref:DUF5658 family protein n=2 Tax=Novosphingobium TaxID=165696 RepID=UPI0025973845|nr:DUF5658 family protein [uncultured Novosphingobium sp.]
MRYFSYISSFIASLSIFFPLHSYAGTIEIARSANTSDSINFDLSHYDGGEKMGTLEDPSAKSTNISPHEVPPTEADAQSVEGPQLPPDIANVSKIEAVASNRFKMPKDIKYIEMGFVAMNVADAAMTIYCVEKGTCIEKNPLYGSRPSPLRVIGVKAAMAGGHYILVREVAKQSPTLARVISITTLAALTGVVGYNATVIF